MADNRAGMPGAGENQSEDTPADPAPSSPQPTQESGQPEPAETGGSGSNRTCIILGVAGGCGCLLLIVLILGMLGVFSWAWFEEEWEEQMDAGAQIESALPGEDPDRETAMEPGSDAAMRWAHNRRSDWRATVDDASDDWTWVRLLMAPAGSDWTTWVELQWDRDQGGYALLAEGPIAQDYDEDVPEIFRPGEQVAREAALGYTEQPDWVTRIDSHSADWTRVTVSVGPPASEWIWVVTLRWNSSIQAYDLVSVDEADHPGF